MARECDGEPWGFSGEPAPVPAETHTRDCGCGFFAGIPVGLAKPEGS